MSSPLLSVDGMFDCHRALMIDDVLDHAVVDGDGRLRVSMIDVLAMVRLAADAEVLVVGFCDGASSALRVPEIVDRGDVFLELQIPEQRGARVTDGAAGSVCLWTRKQGPSAPIVSISAMSFASFVGLE